jgi:hypothetical protein
MNLDDLFEEVDYYHEEAIEAEGIEFREDFVESLNMR